MTQPIAPQPRSQQADLYTVFGCDKPRFSLPRSIDNVGLISMLFLRLGGALHINDDGRRSLSMPCCPDDVPQLPEPEPHEAFRTAEQWEGAMRMLDYLMRRLDPADKDFAFDAFARVVTPQEIQQARAEFAAHKEGR